MKRLLTALLCAAMLMLPMTPRIEAADGEPEAYLVKFRDSDEPFSLVPASELPRLLTEDLVEWYEPDGDALLLDDGEPEYWFDPEIKWDLALIGAGESLAQGCVGAGVRVGVIDSGVAPHLDLVDRMLPGHCYIGGAPDPDDTVDQYGHGTKVAGLIAGAGAAGCSGAAPGVELVPLKCTDGKSVKISAICDAIYGGIDNYGCQVLNLSLGVSSEYQSLADAVAYAADRGVVLVSAAGNNGQSTRYYPAAYETVIGVASVDSTGAYASNSTHNESVWLAAPGAGVRSTSQYGGYTTGSGTSFATPQVTAACAVLLGAAPGLTPEELALLLAESAEDRGEPGWDERYGYGIVRIDRALEALPEEEPAPCEFCEIEDGADGGPGAARAVRNRSEESLDCVYLLAEYAPDGALASLRTWSLTLAPEETAELETPDGTAPFAQYLIEAETSRPLAEAHRGNVGG